MERYDLFKWIIFLIKVMINIDVIMLIVVFKFLWISILFDLDSFYGRGWVFK